MDFQSCNNKLSSGKQRKIGAVFGNWKAGDPSTADIVINNLKGDRFFDHTNEEVANFLIDKGRATISLTQLELRKEHLLHRKGKWVKGEHPIMVGTVISEGILRSFLMTYCFHEFDYEEEVLDDFLLNLKECLYVPKERSHITLKVSNRSIWFFWDFNNSEISPFQQFKKGTKEEVINSLGLGHYNDFGYGEDDLFCISYRNTKRQIGYCLYRPTWVDSDLSHYWGPTKPGLPGYDDHGWTLPLDCKRDNTRRRAAEGVPEAIGVSEKFSFRLRPDLEVMYK